MDVDQFSNLSSDWATVFKNATGSERQLSEWHDRVNTVFVYSLIAGCGVFTNGFPILMTFLTKLRKTKVNVMVANMSSADFLECFVALCGQNFYILYRENLPENGCKFLGFFQLLMAVQVFVFPPFLSLNRYVSLFHGHLYERMFTLKKMYLMIVLSWMLSTVVPLIFLVGGQAKFDQDNEHCCIVTKGSVGWSVSYWIMIIVPLVGCCDGTTMFCNLKILQRLRDHAAVQKLDVNVVKQNREMLLFMVVDMVMPVVTHTVYHVSKFAYSDRRILFFRRFFSFMLMLNSALRGVCTLTLLGPYRREWQRIVGSLLTIFFQKETSRAEEGKPYRGDSWAANGWFGRAKGAETKNETTRGGKGQWIKNQKQSSIAVITTNRQCRVNSFA